jgi:hypothetical protein
MKRTGVITLKKLVLAIKEDISTTEASELLQLCIGITKMLMSKVNSNTALYSFLDVVHENAKFALGQELEGLMKSQNVWKLTAQKFKQSLRSGTQWDSSEFLKDHLQKPGFDENDDVIYEPIPDIIDQALCQYQVAMELSLSLNKKFDLDKELEQFTITKELQYSKSLDEKWSTISANNHSQKIRDGLRKLIKSKELVESDQSITKQIHDKEN